MSSHTLDYITTALRSPSPRPIRWRSRAGSATSSARSSGPWCRRSKVGEICLLRNPGEDFELEAEVVGFAKDAALLTPIGDMHGISATPR